MIARRRVLAIAGAAAVGLLTGCGDDTPAAPLGPGPSPVTGGTPAADDLVARLDTYPSAYRFTPAGSIAYDDEPARARAYVAMRTEAVALLNWARTNGHPDIVPALPSDLAGQEYLLDSLVSNSDTLDSQPLFGAKAPIGRLIPDDETISSDLQGMQSAFSLIMLKTVLSKADYARLVTTSPLVTAAAGKNIISIYPYEDSKNKKGDVYVTLSSGIIAAFVKDPGLRWLIMNPGQGMSEADQKRLVEGGGTLFTEEGYRSIYIDSGRAQNKPATIARTLYDALRSVRP
ncbi:hypothetical protein [Actinoplanes sp. HUAS TT8]|uniref:hypothetical protein n=1 Tax=Actinoplanes sp. HUAS TT8 TaxID=3447453 RepID=UPI003F520ECF